MQTLIIGIGGAGSYLARNARSCHEKTHVLLVNTADNAPQNSREAFLPITDKITTVEQGTAAAMASAGRLQKTMEAYEQLIVMAGLGGNTGTGVLPVVLHLALVQNIKVTAVLTLPFGFEDKRRKIAHKAMQELKNMDVEIIWHNHASISHLYRHKRMDEYLALVAIRIDKKIMHLTQ